MAASISPDARTAAQALEPLRDRLRARLDSDFAPPISYAPADWHKSLSDWLHSVSVVCAEFEGACAVYSAIAHQKEGGELENVSRAVQAIGKALDKLLDIHREIACNHLESKYDEGRVLFLAAVERALRTVLNGLNRFIHAAEHPEQFRTSYEVTISVRLDEGPEMRAFQQWVRSLVELEEQKQAMTSSCERAGNGLWSGLLFAALMSQVFADDDCDQ